jgi:hypothetical protein
MRRPVLIGLVALLLGSGVGWLIGGRFDPSEAEIRAAAEALVPEHAIVTQQGENTGHPLIVGAYFASVEFEVTRVSDLDSVLVLQARALGYAQAHVDVRPGGVSRTMIRRPLRARLTAFTVRSDEGNSRGHVRVDADPGSKRDRRVVGAVVGGLAGVSLVTVLTARRRRS